MAIIILQSFCLASVNSSNLDFTPKSASLGVQEIILYPLNSCRPNLEAFQKASALLHYNFISCLAGLSI